MSKEYVSEKRGEMRLQYQVAVFVETFSTPEGEEKPVNIVISKTLDMSTNGLQVVMDKPINLGSILRLCVQFNDTHTEQRFHLSGEVRWVSKTRFPNQFLVGFKLLESDYTDIVSWKTKMAMILHATGKTKLTF